MCDECKNLKKELLGLQKIISKIQTTGMYVTYLYSEQLWSVMYPNPPHYPSHNGTGYLDPIMNADLMIAIDDGKNDYRSRLPGRNWIAQNLSIFKYGEEYAYKLDDKIYVSGSNLPDGRNAIDTIRSEIDRLHKTGKTNLTGEKINLD